MPRPQKTVLWVPLFFLLLFGYYYFLLFLRLAFLLESYFQENQRKNKLIYSQIKNTAAKNDDVKLMFIA